MWIPIFDPPPSQHGSRRLGVSTLQPPRGGALALRALGSDLGPALGAGGGTPGAADGVEERLGELEVQNPILVVSRHRVP